MALTHHKQDAEKPSHSRGYFFHHHDRKLKSKLRPWVILGCFAIFAVLVLMPAPAGLTDQGMDAIAIFVLCLLFWVSNAVPLMVTSLLAIILLPLLGVMDSKSAYALFGNQAVFFILGAFILASAVMQSGLSTRIALHVLTWFQKSHVILLLGMLVLPAALSYVMSEHAVAAMMFPIVVEIAESLKLKKGHVFAAALFLAMAWGSIIGGVGTFLGGARAVLAVGILEESTGQSITFIEWLIAALPLVLGMLVVAGVVLLFLTKDSKVAIDGATKHLEKRAKALGPMSTREISMAALMIITILLWMFAGHELGLANIALGAVVVAFIFKLLSWKQVEHDVNWGIILMYGGAIALGFALSETGAAYWVAQQLLSSWTLAAFALLAVLSVIVKIFTETMSNTAVVALLMPLALGVAIQYGIDPRVSTMALAIPSGLAFMLPMSTPAVAIALSSGYVSTKQTIQTGLVLHLASAALFLVIMKWYWPLIGFAV